MSVCLFLAGITLDLPKQNKTFPRGSALVLSDVLLIVGVGLGLLLVLLAACYAWMKVRKRRKHISGGEKVYRDGDRADDKDDRAATPDSMADASDARGAEDEDAEDEEHHGLHHHHQHGKRRYKYRVRRRTHRSRNPTLSETGGLPPVKTQDPGKPC